MPLKRFIWTCPIKGCPDPELGSYSELALATMVRNHTTSHNLQEIRRVLEYDIAQKKAEVQKDLNKLEITVIDIGFLKTRGIAIDDDMELIGDGYGKQHKYWKSDNPSVPPDSVGKPVDPPDRWPGYRPEGKD